MDLLQLEHFLAVCEEGTFTRAAERVFRTQSAVSQSIKKLEGEVGAPLFARGTEVKLTDAGEVMLEYARRMQALRVSATRKIEALKGLSAGSLSIGAYEAAAAYLLPNPLRSFLRMFPHITVRIYRTNLDEIPTQVLDREIDLGFVENDSPLHGLEVVPVYSDQMILIASPKHRLVSQQHVSIKDLGNESFVSRHQCNSTTQKISRLFEHYDTPYRVVAELWSFENVKSFVREEVGVALVPELVVREEIRNGSLLKIPVPELTIDRRVLMIYRDEGYVSEPALQLIKLVRQFSDEGVYSADLTALMSA
jgi:DNA-binding transcriptional LysR family regulator